MNFYISSGQNMLSMQVLLQNIDMLCTYILWFSVVFTFIYLQNSTHNLSRSSIEFLIFVRLFFQQNFSSMRENYDTGGPWIECK